MNRMKAAVVTVSVCGLLAGGFASSALAGEGGHVKEVIKHAKEELHTRRKRSNIWKRPFRAVTIPTPRKRLSMRRNR